MIKSVLAWKQASGACGGVAKGSGVRVHLKPAINGRMSQSTKTLHRLCLGTCNEVEGVYDYMIHVLYTYSELPGEI